MSLPFQKGSEYPEPPEQTKIAATDAAPLKTAVSRTPSSRPLS